MAKLEFMLCGSCGLEAELNPYAVTADETRQQILVLINRSPKTAQQISRELGLMEAEVVSHLTALQRCGLVQESQDLYAPTFTIFTAEDQEKLHPLIAQLATAFADTVKARMDRVRAAYSACSFQEAGLTFEDLAYILVGAYIFDYGGLALVREGLLVDAKEMPGGRYVFAALEKGRLALDLRANWQWGHADTYGSFTFYSHGRLPPTGGRRAFPDLAWRWQVEGRPAAEIRQTMQELGEIFAALYPSPKTMEQLVSQLGISAERVAQHVQLLQELEYVGKQGDVFRTLCPVISAEDAQQIWALVDELQHLLVDGVLKPAWERIEHLYADTAPGRNQIDICESFNLLHHLIFEQACQKLLERGDIPWPKQRPDGARYAVWIEHYSGG